MQYSEWNREVSATVPGIVGSSGKLEVPAGPRHPIVCERFP